MAGAKHLGLLMMLLSLGYRLVLPVRRSLGVRAHEEQGIAVDEIADYSGLIYIDSSVFNQERRRELASTKGATWCQAEAE